MIVFVVYKEPKCGLACHSGEVQAEIFVPDPEYSLMPLLMDTSAFDLMCELDSVSIRAEPWRLATNPNVLQ